MNDTPPLPGSRRDFLKSAGRITAASAFAGMALPYVHSGDDNTLQVALIGCGGRGAGAAANALSVQTGPMKLVALADVFEDRLTGSHAELSRLFGPAVDVPADRRFLGFDAYRKAMDCLKPGDIAILATPPAFRWVHFRYAIQKGLHVFMEKPVTVDGPTSRRMFQLAEEATKKNLKVGVGLMIRHCRGRRELHDHIRSGEIGEIVALRANRLHGPVGYAFSGPKPADVTDLMYQVRCFHSFLWASGGLFSDFYIHQIDECCWMKGAWPVKAEAIGGRHYRGQAIDQNFDTYAVTYTFADGTTLVLNGRTMNDCYPDFSSYAYGTKGAGIISTSGHSPGLVRTFKGYDLKRENVIWAFPQPESDPYRMEWEDLTEAIRKDLPYNEVERGVRASLVTSLGRMAAHTGQVVTYEEILNGDHEFAPGLDQLTAASPAPLLPDETGRYPVPEPGIKKKREY